MAGVLTAKIAELLQQEYEPQGFEVLHDHRQKDTDVNDNLGKLRSWFGPSLKSETLLADLDIAIVSHQDNKVYALIEIEETTDKPKVILGDVFATLLGNGIAFQGDSNFLQVGEWTTYIVMVSDKNQSHKGRLIFLNDQITFIKRELSTPNAEIKRIIVDSFTGEEDLGKKLREYIRQATSSSSTF